MCQALMNEAVWWQEAAKLPSEFILDLDFEDIELVEKGLARPLIPVSARFHCACGLAATEQNMRLSMCSLRCRKSGACGSRWTSSRWWMHCNQQGRMSA